MSRKTKPDKKEIAQMVVLSVMGNSDNSIGRQLGRSPHTVRKYRNSEVDLKDPVVQKLINQLTKTETDDLRLLGGKARARLHVLLDEGKTRAIETTAIMDRTFQQRRLLEGESTSNIAFKMLRDVGRKLWKEQKAFEAEMGDEPSEGSDQKLDSNE